MVEAVFEGEENDVKMLVEFCGQGPRGAKVSKAEVNWEPYKNEFRSFSIVYY